MLRPRSSLRQTFWQKNIGLPGVVMVGKYHYVASRLGLLPHSHKDAVEICFLERGEQTYRVNNLVYRLSGNDQFLTYPGEIHDTANLPEEPGTLYWLILKVKPSRNFLGLAGGPASRLTRELYRMPHRHFQAHPDCGKVLGELLELLTDKNSSGIASQHLHSIQIQALLLQYLNLTLQASHQGRKGAASPLIQRVLTYIGKHLDDPVKVPRLAEVARLSDSRFKIRFKREIGVPPADFWLRKKIEKATSILKTRNVTETAYALGFSSSQYFATVFKRYMLASPTQFLAAERKKS